MAGKTVVFYSPKEVAELKRIKREHKKGNVPDLEQALKDWATAHNRNWKSARAKMYASFQKKKKKTSRRKAIVVRAPRVTAPKVFVKHTSGNQLRIPITGIQFEPGFMIVTY